MDIVHSVVCKLWLLATEDRFLIFLLELADQLEVEVASFEGEVARRVGEVVLADPELHLHLSLVEEPELRVESQLIETLDPPHLRCYH